MDKNERNNELIRNKDYDALIRENENLIHFVLKGYHIKPMEYDDYFQIASFALYTAAKYFDENSKDNASFSTFAIVAMKRRLSQTLIRAYNKNKDVSIISYDTVLPNDNGNHDDDILGLIDDGKRIDFDVLKNDLLKFINEASEKLLTDNQKEIYKLYIEDGFTQTEIADKMNCSRQYISLSLHDAFKKIKKYLKRKDVDINYFN